MQYDAELAPDLSPFLPVAWRFLRAQCLHAQRRRARRRDDEWVRLALRYLRWLDKEQTGHRRRAMRPLADVEQAWQLYQANDAQRWHLEARLLIPEPLEQTARACDLELRTVETYEALFFQVKDRLDAPDHIAQRLLPRRAGLGVDIKDTQGLLKLVAYRGGPCALEMALRVLLPSPNSPPLDSQDCSKEVLIERSLDLGCRIHLLSLCVPAEGSPRGLMRIHMLQELGEAWYQLHQGLLDVRLPAQNESVRSWLDDLFTQPMAPPPPRVERDDLAARLGLMQETAGQFWQAAVVGWAA
jgi:hypothetical protein